MWPNLEQIELLKASLLSGDSAREAWQQWSRQIDFDQIDPASYKLLPLVFRNPALERIQDPIFSKCRGVYRQTWVENQLRWKKILPILMQLLDANVGKIVLLKGIAMILHYYRDFGIRVIGDIDILIDRERLPIADRFLRHSGWLPNTVRVDLKNKEHLERWHALNFTCGSELQLDLHWSFIQENSPQMDVQVLAEATEIHNHLYVPNSTDLFLQTCVHGAKQSPVPLIRWIADAMTILKHSKIDWERFEKLAKIAHVCQPLSLALQFLVREFHADIPQEMAQVLKSSTSLHLEILEYRFHARGYPEVADWYRYCLNRGYLSMGRQFLHLGKYLQITARLRSPLFIPFFAVYWIFKRLRRLRLPFNIARKSVL